MTTTTYERPAARVAPGLSFGRVLKSELIKLRSLRSTWITFAVALLIADGLGLLVAGLRASDFHNHPLGRDHVLDAIGDPLHGILFAQLAVGVVGVLYVTGEYATGSIRSSMTAVPRRTPVLLAKATVLAAVTGVVALAMTFIAFLAGQAILSTWGYNVSLGHAGALRAVTGSALYLVCVAVIGLGIGFAIRSTGGAIATLFGLILILPPIASALPSSWQDNINKFLPLNIATNMMSSGSPGTHDLSNAWGAILLVVYAIAALAIGLAVLKRRDV